jgi:glucose-1-phosphate adenylyltransferase
MTKIETVAMILAGGKGTRLGVLTKNNAKPALLYGGKYKVIDFTISNCVNSEIDSIGVLTQYKPYDLNSHISKGYHQYEFNKKRPKITLLPSDISEKPNKEYLGTADAIMQSIGFIDKHNPRYVIVLSGDHIYKMNYKRMLDFHKSKRADATISVYKVPINKAGSFGVMNITSSQQIYKFEEKPKEPKSNLISMGIYVFEWGILKKYLIEDSVDNNSSHDFGENIIPKMIEDGVSLFAYPYDGYWKDIGTIDSYWQANMDILTKHGNFIIDDSSWRIYTRKQSSCSTCYGKNSVVKNSIIADGSLIYGTVKNSIIASGVVVEEGAAIENSIIMANCYIQKEAVINRAILDNKVRVGEKAHIGYSDKMIDLNGYYAKGLGLTVVGEGIHIPSDARIGKNIVVDNSMDLMRHPAYVCAPSVMSF